MSADFNRVPVIEVTKENVTTIWPLIQSGIRHADFLAIDCELSGLGNRKLLHAPSIDERYKYISVAAKTRSIISFGLACFKNQLNESSMRVQYKVTTFNMMVLCSEDYIVEPAALMFLVEHGFDYQKQYSRGLPYYRGDDRENETCHLRDIFSLIVSCGNPVCFHNGLVDLVFLYQNLYAQLPETLDSFVADLQEMFSGGIYDTKYMADYVFRTKASYLAYLFRNEHRMNSNKAKNDKAHVMLEFDPNEVSNSNIYIECPAFDEAVTGDICKSYMNHGHCINGMTCPKSHNIDLAIKHKEGNLFPKKTPKSTSIEGQSIKASSSPSYGNPLSSHSAGVDAFMTGFTLSTFMLRHLIKNDDCDEFKNKVYLGCKDFPLLIQKSNFANISIGHAEKSEKIKDRK